MTLPHLYGIINHIGKGVFLLEIAVMIDLIQSVGFPIFVVIFLLLRTEKKDEKMVEALNELKKIVNDYHMYMIKKEIDCALRQKES